MCSKIVVQKAFNYPLFVECSQYDDIFFQLKDFKYYRWTPSVVWIPSLFTFQNSKICETETRVLIWKTMENITC